MIVEFTFDNGHTEQYTVKTLEEAYAHCIAAWNKGCSSDDMAEFRVSCAGDLNNAGVCHRIILD
ncbi:hypothetical protein [Xanthomonas phage Carpasina]|uniref:Uncharacterized protein n=1 Tax=Xanthomonas phage Carpasina TaxID=2163636 RepID=A0A2S1GSV4_9CAUD|nr:hypothetical protein HOT16_gp83 [Xanthomonas phage Carpasina]AWD92478.1 hypothetical protein [Xanthomonas phage Carpasina]